MCFNNTYGTVCGDFWDETDSQVVCRELFFSSEGKNPNNLLIVPIINISNLIFSIGSLPVTDLSFGSGIGPIYLSNVHCMGDEDKLVNCASNSVDAHQCDHSLDAGVICQGSYLIFNTYTYILLEQSIFHTMTFFSGSLKQNSAQRLSMWGFTMNSCGIWPMFVMLKAR